MQVMSYLITYSVTSVQVFSIVLDLRRKHKGHQMISWRSQIKTKPHKLFIIPSKHWRTQHALWIWYQNVLSTSNCMTWKSSQQVIFLSEGKDSDGEYKAQNAMLQFSEAYQKERHLWYFLLRWKTRGTMTTY